MPFATTLNLSMGDRVDFSVGYGASKSFLGDITALSATISPASVPEPSGFLLLFSGLCCSGLLAWQRGPRQP